MQRVLEPEVMDSWQEAVEYDRMDFQAVNQDFADRAIALGPIAGVVLDAGTGTARIPILSAAQRPQWHIRAIDLGENMLRLGQQNVRQAGLEAQISLECLDAKSLPYLDHSFAMVISNSLVHHLPNPLPFLQEVQRLLQPGGGLLIRDLLRPANPEAVEAIVHRVAASETDYQQQLFRDSLKAALTLAEVDVLVQQAGLTDVTLYQSSERHWTLERAWQPA